MLVALFALWGPSELQAFPITTSRTRTRIGTNESPQKRFLRPPSAPSVLGRSVVQSERLGGLEQRRTTEVERRTSRVATIARDQRTLKHAIGIRQKVFVEEQGIPNAFDQWDRNVQGEWTLRDEVYHALSFDAEGYPVGTGRMLVQSAGTEKFGWISNVAVLKEARRTGRAKQVMELLHNQAKTLGVKWISLHSQKHAIGFYECLGYRTQSMLHGVPRDGPNGVLAFMVKRL
ncbi:hypothetical protein AAMO2058_000788500 [Amorphochlora amoebiformis]